MQSKPASEPHLKNGQAVLRLQSFGAVGTGTLQFLFSKGRSVIPCQHFKLLHAAISQTVQPASAAVAIHELDRIICEIRRKIESRPILEEAFALRPGRATQSAAAAAPARLEVSSLITASFAGELGRKD